MVPIKKYIGVGINFFSVWRLTYLGFLAGIIFVLLFGLPFKETMIGTGIILVTIISIIILYSLSSIKRKHNKIFVSTIRGRIELNNIESVESWWDYDFGLETIEGIEGTTGKTIARTNKINIFLEIRSDRDYVILKEQIHMSSKFPNNHQYIPYKVLDKQKLYRIWDVDNCIKNLGLQEYLMAKT